MPPDSNTKATLQPGGKVIFCAGRFVPGRREEVDEIVRSCRLIPLIYEGVDSRARRSSLDTELREDFFASSFCVLYLDTEPDESFASNWAFPELPALKDKSFCIYAPRRLTEQDVDKMLLGEVEKVKEAVTKLDLPSAVVVATPEQFLSELRRKLSRLLADPQS